MNIVKTLLISNSSHELMTRVAPAPRNRVDNISSAMNMNNSELVQVETAETVHKDSDHVESNKDSFNNRKSKDEKSIPELILDTVIMECQFSIPQILISGAHQGNIPLFEVIYILHH